MDGTLHELTPAELDQIRHQVGNSDPLRRFAAERWLRNRQTYQKRASFMGSRAGRRLGRRGCPRRSRTNHQKTWTSASP